MTAGSAGIRVLPRLPDFFFGREEEQHRLLEHLPSVAVSYVWGLKGTGKSTLLLRWAGICIRQWQVRNRIVWIRCQQGWSLESLLQALAAHFPPADGAYVSEEPHPDSSERRLVQALDELNTLGLFVFIDNGECLGKETLECLLEQSLCYLGEGRLFIASLEPPPLPALRRMDLLECHLQGFSKDEGALYFHSLLRRQGYKGECDDASVCSIVEKIEGHPLLIKYCASLLVAGEVTCRSLAGSLPLHLQEVSDLIFGTLLNSLDTDSRCFIELTSLLRCPLDLPAMTRMAECVSKRTVLRDLRQNLVLEPDPEGKLSCHSLLRHYISRTISSHRKKELHLLCADLYEMARSREQFRVPDVQEELYHLREAGQVERSQGLFKEYLPAFFSFGLFDELIAQITYLEEAGAADLDMSIRKVYYLDIAGQWEKSMAAVEALKNRTEGVREQTLLHYSLGIAYSCRGEIQNAIGYFEQALCYSRQTGGNSDIYCRIALDLSLFYAYVGDYDKSEALIESTAMLVHQLPKADLQESFYRLAAFCCHLRGDTEQALRLIERSIELARDMGINRSFCMALTLKASFLVPLYRYQEAQECLAAVSAAGEAGKDMHIQTLALLTRGRLHFEKGELEEGALILEQAMTTALAHNIGREGAQAVIALAQVTWELQDPARALALARKARQLAAGRGLIREELDASIVEAYIEIERHEYESAGSLLEKIRKRTEMIKAPLYRGLAGLLKAQLYMEGREYVRAQQILLPLAESAQECRNHILMAMASCLLSILPTMSTEQRGEFKALAAASLEHLAGSEKRKIECFYGNIRDELEGIALVKTEALEYRASPEDLSALRARMHEFDLFIDLPAALVCSKRWGAVDLMRKKSLLSLLLLLIRNPGKGSTVREIFHAVWGYEYEGEASNSAVRKIIFRLRALIEPEKGSPSIILLHESVFKKSSRYYIPASVSFCVIEE